MSYPKDIHNRELKDGDIVAEGKVGDLIWEDKAKIIKRPIGIFNVFKNPKTYRELEPECTDFYNIRLIREGLVELLDREAFIKMLGKDTQYMNLYLSTYDGNFYAWDNIEIIGNVNDFK